ncbi:hypothetical protein MMYC01_204076 [Madurella mycetomatis]|uniref:Rhodopsin domain-containing protein n=1 Tax=Madurella mycetomatis TaxID=100816 RepID=A0A175W6V3_9PEZI|nr:hypothetical protein MMYC01_204076 [Madurella mycetomatis]
MSFNVFNESEHGTAFIVAVVSIPVSVLVVFVRVLSTIRTSRKIGMENWFALLALVTFLAYASIDLWILCTMNGRSVFQLGALPRETVIAIYKAGYVMNIQTPLNQTFAKLCLLALYHRLFSVSEGFVAWIYTVGGFQVAWCIAVVCVRLFLCTPIAATLNPFIKGRCLNSQILLAAGDSVNSAIDFVMVGMAVYMVIKLRVSRAAKMKMSVLFALGGFAGIIGIIKVGEAYGTIGTNVRNSSWNMAQQATSIICCCAPIYKSLLSEFSIFNRLGSSLFSGSRSRKMDYGAGVATWPPKLTNTNVSQVGQENWVRLEGSSQHELAWTEVGANAPQQEARPAAHPLKTVEIQQIVEKV